MKVKFLLLGVQMLLRGLASPIRHLHYLWWLGRRWLLVYVHSIGAASGESLMTSLLDIHSAIPKVPPSICEIQRLNTLHWYCHKVTTLNTSEVDSQTSCGSIGRRPENEHRALKFEGGRVYQLSCWPRRQGPFGGTNDNKKEI